MRLLFSTEDLFVHGRPLPGLPLLLDDDGELEPAFHGFMMHVAFEELGVTSKLSWESYGRRLFDFFMFMRANGLKWDADFDHIAATPVRRYRDWSRGELKLSAKTINSRLGVIARFYRWAHSRGMVRDLPFKMKDVRASRPAGFLDHVRRDPQQRKKYDMTLREHDTPIRILSPLQIQICRDEIRSVSHKLLFELMLRTGLRSVEARTFPMMYVALVSKAAQKAVHAVHCDPRHMKLKFDKPRTIHVPGSLLAQLQVYSKLERNTLIADGGDEPSLVLTARGTQFARSTVVSMFANLSDRVGFKVEAHMLRHSYATYTLRALRRSAQYHGDPLLYVRDRLGHSNVQTTMDYLHLVDQLEGQLALAHEDYIDKLFEEVQVE